MGQTLTSTLLIRLTDGLSGPAKKAAGSLEALGKDAKSLAKIDLFKGQSRKLNEMSAALKRAQQNAFAAKRALETAEKPTAALQRAYDKAVRSVDKAKNAFVQQGAAVRAARGDLAAAGIAVNQLAAAEARLKANIDKTTAAHQRQHRAAEKWKDRRGALSGAGLMAGPAVLSGAKSAIHHGAEVQAEKVKMRAAGIPESEIQSSAAQAAELAVKYTNVQLATILERYKELRSVLTHVEETPHMLEPVLKANAAINAIDRTGQMASGLTFAVKGAEVLGLAQEPKRFEEYLDAFIKAQQVMGKTITPEQMYEFAKYSKAAGATLSDRFKFTTGVSLAQELGGSTTGQSVDQFVKQIVGGFQGNNHSAAKEFVALGLAKKTDFETTKTGEIKGFKPGKHVAGHMLAQSDPDQWVYQYLVPALQKGGFDTFEKQIGQIRRMFPAGRAADLVTKLIQQKESFENHAKLYGNAQGLGAVKNNQSDPFVALDSFKTSISNFAATVTSPIMKDAAGVLSGMASSIAGWAESISKWATANPNAAKAVGAGVVGGGLAAGGAMTYGLVMAGVRLVGSAAALNASAAALTAAAGTIGGAGVVGGAGGAAAGVAARAKFGSIVSRLGVWIAAAYAAASGLDWLDPKGNLGGLTKPMDDAMRRGMGLPQKEGGVSVEELWQGLLNLWNSKPPGRTGPGTPVPNPDAKPAPEKMGMFGDVNNNLNITINEAKDGKAVAEDVARRVEDQTRAMFRGLQADTGFTLG